MGGRGGGGNGGGIGGDGGSLYNGGQGIVPFPAKFSRKPNTEFDTG